MRNTIHTAVFINLFDNPYWAISGASHSVIGNDNSAKLDDREENGNTQQTRHDSTSEGSGRGRSNRRSKKSSNSGSNSELPAKPEAINSPTQHVIMGVAIEQVTTAFLNAYIKKDQLSLEWLNKDAGPWLAKIGQLKEK